MSLGSSTGSPFNSGGGNDLYNILRTPNGDQYTIMLHYDFTDNTTIYQDQAGTTRVDTNDQYIRHIKNKSVYPAYEYVDPNIGGSPFDSGLPSDNSPIGRHMVSIADSDAGSPQYKTNVDGTGMNGAYFNGSTSGMYCNSASTALGARFAPSIFSAIGGNVVTDRQAYFIVLKGTGNVSSDETVFSHTGQTTASACGATVSNESLQLTASDDDYDWIMNSGGSSVTNASNINATTNIELWTIYNDNAGSICGLYRNGDTSDGVINLAPTSYPINGVTLAGGGNACLSFALGCSVNNVPAFSQHWEGHIFEILCISDLDTLTRRTEIETFLKNKYNIS